MKLLTNYESKGEKKNLVGFENQMTKYQGQPNWRCKPHQNPNAMHLMGLNKPRNKETPWRGVVV